MAFLGQPNTGKFAISNLTESSFHSASSSCASQSPLFSGQGHAAAASGLEAHKLREEVAMLKGILVQWEERVAQARSVSGVVGGASRPGQISEQHSLLVISLYYISTFLGSRTVSTNKSTGCCSSL